MHKSCHVYYNARREGRKLNTYGSFNILRSVAVQRSSDQNDVINNAPDAVQH